MRSKLVKELNFGFALNKINFISKDNESINIKPIENIEFYGRILNLNLIFFTIRKEKELSLVIKLSS